MFRRILLALDGDDSGPVATSFAIALARSSRAAVQVVHVNEYLAGGRGPTCESEADAVGVVTRAMTDLEEAGVPAAGATYRTATFDVPAAICELAEQCRADVIVLGSRRRRFGSFLRRSMRDRVTRRTQLPVLLAPAPLEVERSGRALETVPTFPDPAPCDLDRAVDRER